ncbi:MAG: hypothetical protein LBB65_01450 [Burkholderiales bacterium]|jgi:hypothetical protein|nr:hypothetical protein [Burkholderiales bacterium]
MAKKLPNITWLGLLLSAPYFTSALFDAADDCETPPAEWPLLPRAVVYWMLLDGEVSNGEVIWYNADGTASGKGWFKKGKGG